MGSGFLVVAPAIFFGLKLRRARRRIALPLPAAGIGQQHYCPGVAGLELMFGSGVRVG